MNKTEKLTRETFRGPWAGLPVAWTDDDRFDEKTYRGDVARCCEAGIPGVYTGGTTGEFYAMEYEEFTAVTDATIGECKQAGVPVMIGCTSTHTLGAVRRARYAAERGADAIQIALPCWMALTDDEAVRFVVEVAEAVPGLPISLYETLRSKRALPLAAHRRIHEAVPAVLSVKSNEDTIGCSPDGCAALNEFCNVFVGENELSELGPHGAVGCCSSMVYCNPRKLLRMFELLETSSWDELQVLTGEVNLILTEGLQPLFARGLLDSALDRLMGLATGFLRTSLRCRGPYASCTAGELARFQDWMGKRLPDWMEL